MRAIPFDLDLAEAGYLRSPDGKRVRHVLGLDRIAQEARSCGCLMYWADLGPRQAGWADCPQNRIVLAAWLFDAWPWYFRLVVIEEVGHLIIGTCEELVTRWRMGKFRELVEPM